MYAKQRTGLIREVHPTALLPVCLLLSVQKLTVIALKKAYQPKNKLEKRTNKIKLPLYAYFSYKILVYQK
jgi:hypothetical protein